MPTRVEIYVSLYLPFLMLILIGNMYLIPFRNSKLMRMSRTSMHSNLNIV